MPSKAFAGTHKPSFAPFRSDFSDTSPPTPLHRPDWFRLPAAPTQLVAAMRAPHVRKRKRNYECFLQNGWRLCCNFYYR
jgi:hypothetical protein